MWTNLGQLAARPIHEAMFKNPDKNPHNQVTGHGVNSTHHL